MEIICCLICLPGIIIGFVIASRRLGFGKPNPHVVCRRCGTRGTVVLFQMKRGKYLRQHGKCKHCRSTFPL